MTRPYPLHSTRCHLRKEARARALAIMADHPGLDGDAVYDNELIRAALTWRDEVRYCIVAKQTRDSFRLSGLEAPETTLSVDLTASQLAQDSQPTPTTESAQEAK